jgi:hypothetical protein
MTGPTLQSVSDRLNPAVHGIALRKGTEWIVRFPSALRLTGSAATLSTLHELAAVLGYTPEALDAARRSGQVTLYGFETIDLVQFADGSPPGIFERGGIGRSPDVSIGNVRSKLGQVGRHLLTHVWTDPDGGSTLAGTYFPMSDRYRPVQAEDRDVALAILALDRLGDDDALPGVSPAAAEARDALLRTIGVEDPIVAAIHVGLGRAGEEATALVASTLDDQNQPRLTRAIAAWALASQPQCSDRVRRFLLETASSPPEEIESLLPWIGWADVGCAAEAEATPLLLATWRSLPGRFSEALTASQRPPAARLTSNLLRQAAFLPTALGTCDDPALAAASLEDIDFLLNALIVGETEASLTRAPSSTLGGVRTAAWDERMTIPTQAFAILLLDDMVERMEVGEAAGMAEVDP